VDEAAITAAVPQIAAELLRRTNRQPWANSGHSTMQTRGALCHSFCRTVPFDIS
jgi:hypothetical protein